MANEDEDDLDSFKIGDRKRPEIRSFTKEEEAQAESESFSVGFPSIEERLEAGDIEVVAEELRGSYEKLEALAEGNDKKLKAAASKAMAAYERTADLFEYLYETKSALLAPPDADE